MLSKRILFILLGILLSAFGRADIKEAREWIVTTRVANLYKWFTEDFGYPVLPITNGVTLIGDQKPGSTHLYLFAPESEDPVTLAEPLDAWRANAGYPGDVSYSVEDEGAVAHFSISSHKFLGKIVGSTIDLAPLAKALGSRSGDLRIGWIVPNYVRTQGLPPGNRGERLTTFDLSNTPPADIRVTVEVSALSKAGAIAFAVWLPFWACTGLLLSRWYAGRESVPIGLRRRRYGRILYGATFGGILTHVPIAFFIMFSDAGRMATDAWFGARPISVFGPMLFLGILIPMAILPYANRSEKRLFGPAPGDPKVVDEEEDQAKPKGTVLGWVKEHRFFILGFAILLIGFMVPAKSDWKQPVIIAAYACIFLPILLSARSIKDQAKSRPEADEETKDLADKIAWSMGMARAKVVLAEPSAADPIGAGVWSKDTIMVTPGFVSHLTDPEKRFILAHEYAHIKQGVGRRPNPVLFFGLGMLLLSPFLLKIWKVDVPTWTLGASFALIVIMVPIQLFLASRSRKQMEFDADRMAMEVTGDPEAAVSALRKVQFGSEMPHMHDSEWQFTHPEMFKRIEALKALGTKLP